MMTMTTQQTETSNLITTVYYDSQDPANQGWAYRCDEHGPQRGESGSLDGHEDEDILTRDEALDLARQAAACGDCTEVHVYWHGDREPLVFASRELTASFAVGERVCGGTEGTEDYDEGRVIAVEGDSVTVAWDSLVQTTQPASLLRSLSR